MFRCDFLNRVFIYLFTFLILIFSNKYELNFSLLSYLYLHNFPICNGTNLARFESQKNDCWPASHFKPTKARPHHWPVSRSEEKKLNPEIYQISSVHSYFSMTSKTSKSCVWRSDLLSVSGLLLQILWTLQADRRNKDRKEVESRGLILNKENEKGQNETMIIIVHSPT